MYLYLGVETTLLHTILDVVVPEVGVLIPQGYSTIFPPNVNLDDWYLFEVGSIPQCGHM